MRKTSEKLKLLFSVFSIFFFADSYSQIEAIPQLRTYPERIRIECSFDTMAENFHFIFVSFNVRIINGSSSELKLKKKTLFLKGDQFCCVFPEVINVGCGDLIKTSVDVCYFGNNDGFFEDTIIKPGESYLYSDGIYEYAFRPGGEYKVRFQTTPSKAGFFAQSDWIYFSIPERSDKGKFKSPANL